MTTEPHYQQAQAFDSEERGIAQVLLARTMEQFDAGNAACRAVHLSAQREAYRSRSEVWFLRTLSLQSCQRPLVAAHVRPPGRSRFSDLNTAQQNEALLACQNIADTLYPGLGLDLTEEIRATQGQGLGDTVLIDGTRGIGAFAVCHYGPRSEAGADACFIKFGAVRVGAPAEQAYLRLLDACEA